MKKILFCLFFVSEIASAQGRLNLSLVKRQVAGPSFALGTTFFSPSTNVTGTASSPQGTSVIGSLLTNPITVAAATGFQYSKTIGGTYTSTLTYTPSSGSVNDSLYVRVAPATAAGNYTGPIVVSSTGASPSSLNISVNATVSSAGSPTITASPSSLTLTTVQGSQSSPPQTFTLGGTNLTGGIVATFPASFLGGTDGVNYSTSATIPQSGGTANQLIYTVINQTAPAGNPTGTVTFTSPGVASPPTVNLIGTVTASGPVVDTIIFQAFFSLATQTPVSGWINIAGGPDTSTVTYSDPRNYQPCGFKYVAAKWLPLAGAGNHSAANPPNGASSFSNVNFPSGVVGGYDYNLKGTKAQASVSDTNVIILNLDPAQLYVIEVVSSRSGANHPVTMISADSTNLRLDTASYDAGNNITQQFTFQNLVPDANGIIRIGIWPRSGNFTTGNQFGYMNAIRIRKQSGRKSGGIVVFNNNDLIRNFREMMAINKKQNENNGWFYSGPPNLKRIR